MKISEIAVLCLLVTSGCWQAVPEEIVQATQAARETTVCSNCPQSWSASQGFVVHEWGTVTMVLGSDASVLPGLHHEEEDLPAFVTDRLRNAPVQPYGVSPYGGKMETPVTYFYSSSPRDVSARVRFPRGLLTQWYPEVKHFEPVVYGSETQARDSWALSVCSTMGAFPEYSELDWGTFKVLGRDVPLEEPSNPGLSWDFARNVKANVLAVPARGLSEQREKFLFYRGLSEAPPTFRPHFEGERLVLQNDESLPRGGLLLMNVTKEGAGLSVLGDLPAGERKLVDVPKVELTHDVFVEKIRALLEERLVASGLYADEARAMVDTWERSYFLTPGVRLLYLLPQRELDVMLPLDITPKPDLVVRAMVIRLELQPPSREAQLMKWAWDLGHPGTEDARIARDNFLALGRFAEPLLERTLQLSPEGSSTWNEVFSLQFEVKTQQRWAPVTVE